MGHLAVPGGQKHEQVHHLLLLEEDVPLGHLAHGAERVLDDAHDRFISLRGDDLPGRDVDVLHLGASLHTLRHVQVHLVAVEIRVVGRRAAQVHAERRPRQDFDAMTHHRHFVQRRLPVEDHQIAVADVPLHFVSALQVQVGRFRVKPEYSS